MKESEGFGSLQQSRFRFDVLLIIIEF